MKPEILEQLTWEDIRDINQACASFMWNWGDIEPFSKEHYKKALDILKHPDEQKGLSIFIRTE